jgi:ATP-dependent Clp protease ATP-binding subunit ClpB
VQGEKEAVQKIRSIREEIEQTKVAVEQAHAEYDLNRAAELQYGKLTQLEKQLLNTRTGSINRATGPAC